MAQHRQFDGFVHDTCASGHILEPRVSLTGLYFARMHASAQPAPAINERSFYPFLRELAGFETTRELERSGLYRQLKTDIHEVLQQVWQEQLVDPLKTEAKESSITAIAWNIERGIRIDAVARLLREH